MSALQHEFSSDQLGNTRRVWVEKVGRRDDDEPLPLLVLFDGDWYRDPERVDSCGTIARLVRDGRIPPLAVAYVSHIDIQIRAEECPMHPRVPAFVADELLPWLRNEAFGPAVRIATDAADTILGGLSYSGLLAAWAMLNRPEIADRLLCQSASFWSQDNRMLEELDRLQPPSRHWWIDVGLGETETNVEHEAIGVLQVDSQLDANRWMRDRLLAAGHTVTFHEFDGGHDFACWKRTLPFALETLFARG